MPNSDGTRAIRQDAARNREQLLIAARQVFADRGHDVALEEVARAASVSRTTLYRHFATREQLAAVVFEDNVAHLEQQAGELANRDDGIVRLFDVVVDMQVANRSFAAVLADADIDWFRSLADRTQAAFESLLGRGIEAGLVHADVDAGDIMLAVSMAGAIAEGEGEQRARDIRRGRALLHRSLFVAGPASTQTQTPRRPKKSR